MKTSITSAPEISSAFPDYYAPEIKVYGLSLEGILCASSTEGVGDDYGSWN